jgi:nucleoside-diphosphate-sugar epimerase
MEKSGKKVLITGVSGFLGSWVLKKFIECKDQKFDVRGTVRDPTNEEKIAPLRESIGGSFDDVELIEANLMDPASIDKAVAGCDYVIHTASPYPTKMPKNEDELIKPAVDGTRAVLDACKKHKVKRLVVTSSMVAIVDYSKYEEGLTVDENDWLEDYDSTTSYSKSKALAEKLCYDYVKELPEKDRFDVVTINPGVILGPILGKSILLIFSEVPFLICRYDV